MCAKGTEHIRARELARDNLLPRDNDKAVGMGIVGGGENKDNNPREKTWKDSHVGRTDNEQDRYIHLHM